MKDNTNFIHCGDPTLSVHAEPVLLPKRTFAVKICLGVSCGVSANGTRQWQRKRTHAEVSEEGGANEVIEVLIQHFIHALHRLIVATCRLDWPRRLSFTVESRELRVRWRLFWKAYDVTTSCDFCRLVLKDILNLVFAHERVPEEGCV